jgi:branched-chain amino acid transport system substrate-binding protein
MRRRIGILIAVLLAAAACAQGQTNELEIGAIYPLSGPQAAGGKQELAGVRAALELAQRSGDLKQPVRLRVIDAVTPAAAAAAVDTLAKDHVPAIFGTYGSTLSAAASARAEEKKIVYWETGAVADPITAHRHYVFRTVATGSSLGRMAVSFTQQVLLPRDKLVSPRVVIVRVDDIYGRSVGDGEQAIAKGLGLSVVDVIGYDTRAYDAATIAARVKADRPDYLWDISYIDDGVAIWLAIVNEQIPLKAAIGTSSAFCMPDFARRTGVDAIGVYAADKPDGMVSETALSPDGRSLLAQARSIYQRANGGAELSISAVAGFVGGWTFLHSVLPSVAGTVTPDTLRNAALGVDIPIGDSINGGGVKFGNPASLDEGQNHRSAAVVGQWQSDGGVVMKIVFPAAYATGVPINAPSMASS